MATNGDGDGDVIEQQRAQKSLNNDESQDVRMDCGRSGAARL